VNSIISGIAVLGAELFQSLGVPLSGSHKNAAFAAAFAQSPNGGLVVDGASLRIIGANERRLLAARGDRSDNHKSTYGLHRVVQFGSQEFVPLPSRIRSQACITAANLEARTPAVNELISLKFIVPCETNSSASGNTVSRSGCLFGR
jgi:hypothetical protein